VKVLQRCAVLLVAASLLYGTTSYTMNPFFGRVALHSRAISERVLQELNDVMQRLGIRSFLQKKQDQIISGADQAAKSMDASFKKEQTTKKQKHA
jgi:hypothetical protein